MNWLLICYNLGKLDHHRHKYLIVLILTVWLGYSHTRNPILTSNWSHKYTQIAKAKLVFIEWHCDTLLSCTKLMTENPTVELQNNISHHFNLFLGFCWTFITILRYMHWVANTSFYFRKFLFHSKKPETLPILPFSWATEHYFLS